MKYILSWSGGKDSTASAILAKIHDLPIDGIITVMPDPFKLEYEFMERFQEYMKMTVTVIEGPKFEDYFYAVKSDRSVHPSTIYGWPMTAWKTCARIMKWEPMQRYVVSQGGVSLYRGNSG